jgi:hypothetical protein
MNAGLRELLGLPAISQPEVSGEKGAFNQTFREKIAELNQKMQLVAAQGDRVKYQEFDSDRQKLIGAYQVASAQSNPAASERVLAAIGKLGEKVSSKASDFATGHAEWEKRKPEFDAVMLQIGELEDEGHPKAAALRKLGDAIRDRVNERNYKDSIPAFDQLQPRLDTIRSEIMQQNDGNSQEQDALSPQDREAMWQELEEIERHLELLLSEHQITL